MRCDFVSEANHPLVVVFRRCREVWRELLCRRWSLRKYRALHNTGAVAVLSSLKVHISSSHHHRTAYATTHTHTCDIHIYRLIASSAQALSINNMKYTRVHIARARTSPRHRRLRSSSAVVRQRPSQSTHSHVVALVPSQQQPRTLPTTLHTVGRNSPIRKSVVEEKRKTITMAIELYLE